MGAVEQIIYVDSGSTDGSREFAQSVGADVVDLDTTIPFTAARARNAGVERLRQVAPSAQYVQMIDGDCELDPDWIPTALGFMEENPGYAAVAGRVRERFPGASVYNYLCDFEWNMPPGDADATGGNAFVRVEAFVGVNGFNPALIAGEEPELGVRLRAAGWKLRRLDHEMVLHDANITRFSQWWTRARRAGHAYAEGAAMHGASTERHWVRESRRVMLWGLVLPVIAIGAAPFTAGLSMSLLLLYPINVARLALRLRRQGEARPWAIALFLAFSKLPEAQGWLRYHLGRLTGRRSKLIEYRG
jgi:GT2 family glycosyltransferase